MIKGLLKTRIMAVVLGTLPIIASSLVVDSESAAIAIMNTAAFTTISLLTVSQVLVLPPHFVATENTVFSYNKDNTSVAT